MTIQTPMTEQQVLIHLMLAMAAADEAISDAELSRVERLIDFLPVFENFPPEDLDIVTESFVELISVEEGLDSLMTLLANTLPDELHETAYALRWLPIIMLKTHTSPCMFLSTMIVRVHWAMCFSYLRILHQLYAP